MTKHLIAVALTFVLAACGNSDSRRSELTSNDTAPVAADATVSTVRSSVSKNPLIAGQIQSASVTLTSTASLQDLVVEIRIYDSVSNGMYAMKILSPVSIAAGAQQTLTFDFQSPADMPPGQYDIRVGVWDGAWTRTYLYEVRDHFTVNAPPTSPQVSIVSSSVSQNPLTAGQLQSTSIVLTSPTALQGLIVDIRIYNSATNALYTKGSFSPVSIVAGAQQQLTFEFQSPASMPPGQYDVRVGVWNSSWDTLLYETRNPFTVGGTSFVMNCDYEVLLSAGSYNVQNNQWGRGGITNYSQCVANGGVAADGSVSARWTWTWPNPPGSSEIKAYPAIVFGQKPGYAPTPNTHLPKQINTISQVTSSWSTHSSYTGTGQLTFDMWLTRDGLRYDSFDHTPITHEVMIAVEPYNGYGLTNRNPATFVEDITINGVHYKTYKMDGVLRWRFLVFEMQSPMISGSLDLKPLFDYLKIRGFIQGTEYLSSIEFGSEVQEGTGDVTVDSFKATVQ